MQLKRKVDIYLENWKENEDRYPQAMQYKILETITINILLKLTLFKKKNL